VTDSSLQTLRTSLLHADMELERQHSFILQRYKLASPCFTFSFSHSITETYIFPIPCTFLVHSLLAHFLRTRVLYLPVRENAHLRTSKYYQYIYYYYCCYYYYCFI